MGKNGKGTRRLLADYRLQVKAMRAQEELVRTIRADLGELPAISQEHYGGGSGRPAEAGVLRLADEEELLKTMRVRMAWRKQVVKTYIENVTDPQVKTVLWQRYINGMSWRKMSMRYGAGSSESTLRMMVNRYTDRNPIKWLV